MRRLSDFLWCVIFAFFAIVITIKLSDNNVAKAEGPPPSLPELTAPKFVNPVSRLDLQIDLNKGTTRIESDAGITTVNSVVNHPAPQVKTIIKKEIAYETKTEYLTKLVMFPLPTPKLHVPSIKYPTRVSK